MSRIILGTIGPKSNPEERKYWNTLFQSLKLDALYDFYRTRDLRELELRLSEMFHLGRRGYAVENEELKRLALPLMDVLDRSATAAGNVDTIVNEGGVLIGHYVKGNADARLKLWTAIDKER